ncbi:class II aldolase/adducin family protein [Alkalimarinus alittae]|uniref:Class II aldolase/adducin family protein n=1 Tax=Alkalimarinus alittae TaxID=2961619 RepID=A0ABY6N5I3_9ALTE|nr:class II aldolase/adducin family protein [Alkalimarinus alittae]UZE97391.1 class II aldolase/adducin family protein [Alkalimarinus alittae]
MDSEQLEDQNQAFVGDLQQGRGECEEGHEREGVIKYKLLFNQQPIPSCMPVELLDMWRHVLFNLKLVGQDPQRYGGLGFGNISTRVPTEAACLLAEKTHQNIKNAFLISGSQTGHLPYLSSEHCAVVTRCFPKLNHLIALGECKPSSESLTHGVLYNEFPSVGAVVHVHSPLIWRLAERLSLPTTCADIPYGTTDMAAAVVSVANDISAKSIAPVFAMKGHRDGIVSFGPDLASAISTLLSVYHQSVMKTVR